MVPISLNHTFWIPRRARGIHDRANIMEADFFPDVE